MKKTLFAVTCTAALSMACGSDNEKTQNPTQAETSVEAPAVATPIAVNPTPAAPVEEQTIEVNPTAPAEQTTPVADYAEDLTLPNGVSIAEAELAEEFNEKKDASIMVRVPLGAGGALLPHQASARYINGGFGANPAAAFMQGGLHPIYQNGMLHNQVSPLLSQYQYNLSYNSFGGGYNAPIIPGGIGYGKGKGGVVNPCVPAVGHGKGFVTPGQTPIQAPVGFGKGGLVSPIQTPIQSPVQSPIQSPMQAPIVSAPCGGNVNNGIQTQDQVGSNYQNSIHYGDNINIKIGEDYFRDTFRPITPSSLTGGAFWEHQQPQMFNDGRYAYFNYPSAMCSGWGFCQ